MSSGYYPIIAIINHSWHVCGQWHTTITGYFTHVTNHKRMKSNLRWRQKWWRCVRTLTINLIKQRFLKYKVFDVEGSLRGTFTLLIGGIIFMILLNKRSLAINSTFLSIEDSLSGAVNGTWNGIRRSLFFICKVEILTLRGISNDALWLNRLEFGRQ